MGKVFVFGHRNPDTDTICSAIAYANLKEKLGMNVEPVRLGEINEETKYALNYFNVAPPRFVETVANEVKKVILVDHNERQQSVADIEKVQIIEVIDHHRIANFETEGPLFYRAEPVGCTATIINKLYKENNQEIEKEIAGLMLSAIISDSLLFKSPTCTEEDVKVAHELAAIAGVDINVYGLEMLRQGANVANKTITEIISLDAKLFQMGDYNVEIAQVNVVDTNDVYNRQQQLEAELDKRIKEKDLDLFLLVVTDILNSDSLVLSYGDSAAVVEHAYNVKLVNNKALLKGVVSRKKQIVPILTDVFKEM